jgi:hypothetical protein
MRTSKLGGVLRLEVPYLSFMLQLERFPGFPLLLLKCRSLPQLGLRSGSTTQRQSA